MEQNIDEINSGPVKAKYDYLQPLLLAAMVALGMIMGYKMNDKAERLITKINGKHDVSLGRVEEMIRFIESRYVDTVNSDAMVSEAINAMLSKLDPHSVYINPSDLKEVSESMEGNFTGLGIESYYLEDTAVIITIVKDSPASKAGLKQFDQIISVNDTVVAGVGMSFDKIRERLRSSKTAKIEIKRKGSSTTLIKIVKLDNIVIHSADVAYIIKDSIGYIRIEQFSSNTYNEFMTNLEYLHDKKGMRNLIIDLRGNPGGYLPQATKIINQLIREKEKLIVYTEGRKNKREDYFTNGKTFFPNLNKIAVLVDEHSASGSEVIAGAIQDHDRGIIIGRKTYGKGLVQEQFNLSNGGALRLTTARYYTPSGRCIQKEFTDMDTYDNEIYKRSVYENNTKRDSSKTKAFKTLIKGRTVYSGGGIDPEVFIAGDSLLLDKEYPLLDKYALEYLTKQLVTNKLTTTTNVDYKLLTKNFIAYIAAKEKTPEIKIKLLSKAQQELEEHFEYLKSNGDSDARSKIESMNDKFIKSAIDYIEGRIKL
jgi:carboxyl-terminal processing protease